MFIKKVDSWHVCACALILCTPVFNASAEVKRDLDSHEHGASQLSLVLDGQSIFLEFESPWENLIGFEHAPSTERQRNVLADAHERLSRTSELFVINAEAGCVPERANVDSALQPDNHDGSSEAESASADGHGDTSEHDEEHSEVVVAYVFTCEQPSRLEQMDVELLRIWPGIDDIDVLMAGPGGQTAVELNSEQSIVDLRTIQ